MATRALNSVNALVRRLRYLHRKRKERPEPVRRRALTPNERREVLAKTGGRCHICGGRIKRGARWAADHILAHAHGGKHEVANYLPAHGECNNIRRHFLPEEFRWILKLGVFFRTGVERERPRAMALAEQFVTRQRRNEIQRGDRVLRDRVGGS